MKQNHVLVTLYICNKLVYDMRFVNINKQQKSTRLTLIAVKSSTHLLKELKYRGCCEQ